MCMKRSTRILILLVIDVVFFFVELIVGYAVGSLALVADSFHMLNDVLSLIVAFYAIRLTSQQRIDSKYSYGWHRAEILAALVNGVFLLALCFSIFLEAIERFFSTPEISQPVLVVVVGSLGLASNLVGLFLFHEHSHAHPHTKSTSPAHTPVVRSRSESASESSMFGLPAATRQYMVQSLAEVARADAPGGADERTALLGPGHAEEGAPPQKSGGHGHGHGSMNMHALVLHVFGDALGNVGVIATGLVIWLTHWSWKYYFDPMISLVITVIIFSSALPLVRSTSSILLQGVPATVSLDEVRSAILDVDGVLSLHELHVWQLSESKIVASVHVMASRKHDFMPVAADIRRVLHERGIHSSTIQPEYHQRSATPGDISETDSNSNSCLILCPPDQTCAADNACCPPPPPAEV
ncbi:cation efflux protein [Phanerochaete sordida]|uniref:Cation efflux protein n=1 Tax=Phanerochaete sordida TaxID=48140 RepID=A0A9P3LM34_9APHY|nr:cation efflux protein [Phanerochaete sordida]